MKAMIKVTINLTALEIKKLGELVNTEMKDETDVEYAIRVILENS